MALESNDSLDGTAIFFPVTEYKKTVSLDEGLDNCVHDRDPSPVGGLPLELWWNILEIVDSGRALLTCGETCQSLHGVVQKLISRRSERPHTAVMGYCGKELLTADPTRGFFRDELAFRSPDLLSWLCTFPVPCPRLRRLRITGEWQRQTRRTLTLRFRTRLALSRLKTITHLELSSIHFSSFSEFARLVCTLPNLVTLWLSSVTVTDRDSSTLEGAYFAHGLRLKRLWIENCAFGESHPIWNLLTAPSLSDSLEHIDIESDVGDPQQALQELTIPPAALFESANLARLARLHFDGYRLPCGDLRTTLCRNLLRRSPAGRITAIEISYACDHSPPHINECVSLFSVLDDAQTASSFSCLTTISVSFWAEHPFDVEYMRTLVGSQSHSSKWTATFTMSSMMFKPENIGGTHSLSGEASEKTEVATEDSTAGIALNISFCPSLSFPNEVAVVYTRRQVPDGTRRLFCSSAPS